MYLCLPFECSYACIVEDFEKVERLLHDAFLDHRVRSNREFFEVSPGRAVSVLKLVEIEDVTPKKDFVQTQEDQKALDKARTKRRSRFNFRMVDIAVGAELIFSRDENIKAKVVDDHLIEFNGEIISLSLSAQRILNLNYSISGTEYWTYEGETLDDRRWRLESEE